MRRNLSWVAPVAGAVASFAQSLANGASFGQALGAAAIGAGIGLVTGGILGGIGDAITNEALKNVYTAALIGSGVGTIAQGAVEGQYITAGVGATLLALGLVSAFSQRNETPGRTLHKGRGEAGAQEGQQGRGDLFRPARDDIVRSIQELEANREVLRFEGLDPSQVIFDPSLPTNQGQTHCGLFRGCTVSISETFTNQFEFTATLWHESVHIHRGWFGALYPTQHMRLVAYDGEVIRALRTGDFGRLTLPATATGGLDLSVPGPLERR